MSESMNQSSDISTRKEFGYMNESAPKSNEALNEAGTITGRVTRSLEKIIKDEGIFTTIAERDAQRPLPLKIPADITLTDYTKKILKALVEDGVVYVMATESNSSYGVLLQLYIICEENNLRMKNLSKNYFMIVDSQQFQTFELE